MCNGDYFAAFLTFILYAAFQAYSIHLYNYIKKTIHPTEASNKAVTFLYNYRLYQLITSILWTIIAMGLIFNDLYTRKNDEPLGWGYYIFVPLNNCSKTLQSILLTAYRYREPSVRKTVEKLVFF
jgi:hypothetical protein